MPPLLKNREMREIGIGLLAFLVLVAVLTSFYRADPRAAPGDAAALRLVAEFSRIDGLVLGDPVYVSGVRVGTVTDLSLTDDYRVAATFSLTHPVALPADTSAAIHTDGLFGSKFVTLDPGGADDVLQDGGRLRYTQDAIIVSKLFDLIIAEGHAARGTAPSVTQE